jgi:hypothetical protein
MCTFAMFGIDREGHNHVWMQRRPEWGRSIGLTVWALNVGRDRPGGVKVQGCSS